MCDHRSKASVWFSMNSPSSQDLSFGFIVQFGEVLMIAYANHSGPENTPVLSVVQQILECLFWWRFWTLSEGCIFSGA